MLECYRARTGMEVREGCELSVRLYAVAAQIYSLYVQADWVGRQCFPQTAQGEFLDRHALLRGLTRKPAARALGTIRFFVTSAADTDRPIPAGTVCMTAKLVRFETTMEGVLKAGELEADVPAIALEPGVAGNVGAGEIVSMAVAPVGVEGCGNPSAFTGGTQAEEDGALRERVLDTFRRLPNGANAAFYEQGALSFDQVAAASVLPRARGQGTVDVVAATHSGVPDELLLKALRDYFAVRREIAVDVAVRGPETVGVKLAVKVKAAPGQSGTKVRAGVEKALRDYFTGALLGKDVLRARLCGIIYNCPGVENYVLESPARDVQVGKDQLPVIETLGVEAMA